MAKRHLLLLAAPATIAMTMTGAFGNTPLTPSAGDFRSNLEAVPHDHVADGGSHVVGDASLRLNGRKLLVNLRASGLTPKEPHAMHIHGETTALNECPDISADDNNDGLIDLGEGLPDYGPIDVSLTKSGDTSPDSGLTLERFPVADAAGNLSYDRSIRVPKAVAKNLTQLHIVLHGTDLPSDDDASSLSSLFEATMPVSCGEIN